MINKRNLSIFWAVLAAAYYAVAPFIGVALSFLIFREMQGPAFWAALVIMILGTYFAA